MDIAQFPEMQEIEEYLQCAQMGIAVIGGLKKRDVFIVMSTLRKKYAAIIENLTQQLEKDGQMVPVQPSAASVRRHPESFEAPSEAGFSKEVQTIRQKMPSAAAPDTALEYRQMIRKYTAVIAKAEEAEKQAEAARSEYVKKALYLSEAIVQAGHRKAEILQTAQNDADKILEQAQKEGQEQLRSVRCEAAAYLERTRTNIRRQIEDGDRKITEQKEALRTIKRETVQIVKKAGYILDHVERDMHGSAEEIAAVRKKLQDHMLQSSDDLESEEDAPPLQGLHVAVVQGPNTSKDERHAL